MGRAGTQLPTSLGLLTHSGPPGVPQPQGAAPTGAKCGSRTLGCNLVKVTGPSSQENAPRFAVTSLPTVQGWPGKPAFGLSLKDSQGPPGPEEAGGIVGKEGTGGSLQGLLRAKEGLIAEQRTPTQPARRKQPAIQSGGKTRRVGSGTRTQNGNELLKGMGSLCER